jgi:hypothetical protein
MIRLGLPLLLAAALQAQPSSHDIVIYGGTSAAVIAAVQAKKMGRSVIIISPDKHLGGLSSGGLGYTDTGNKATIGGLSRDFYHRVWLHYQKPEAWAWQEPSEYGGKGQGTPAMDGENRTMWIFEPHVAEQIFEDYVKENQLTVLRDEWLDRSERGVAMKEGRITAITTVSGKTFAGSIFIDATYEGDLMAAAKVSYHVGRESTATYGEKWNGVQVGVLHHHHHFGEMKISAYKVPGDPSSGVLPEISTQPPGAYQSGDAKVQAYCYRMCLTNHPDNRIPFPKPEGYDPARYELLRRVFEKGWKATFNKFDEIPNRKTDTNNHGPFSTDYIGGNWDYPDASYERRAEILRDHQRYQQGWLYFIANDPSVPAETRERMQTWGLPKDEFKDNGGWSHQLYIREARRMIGTFVMTEHELLKKKPTPQSVGMGSYGIDSHNIQRYVTPEGHVQNEGDIGVSTMGPYQIAYGALTPKKEQCENLLVPVACGASHIAYGSIRMEPVFMILGQSAATAAILALDAKQAVQDVSYDALQARLLADGQILDYKGQDMAKGLEVAALKGVIVDDVKATTTGHWQASSAAKSYLGQGYQHEGKGEQGPSTATFTTVIPSTGRYTVRLAAPPNSNRAPEVWVKLSHAGGTEDLKINQQTPDHLGLFHTLGTFDFTAGSDASVTVSNAGAKGHVVIDAVQWEPAK